MRESESQRKLKEVSREHTGSAENNENLINLGGPKHPNDTMSQGVREEKQEDEHATKCQDLICLLYSDFGIATK